MKPLANVLTLLALALSLISCSLQEKYDANEASATAYLQEKKTAPAAMNIEGLWYSPTWGIVIINQEPGGKLTGLCREYLHIKGVVSGKRAYLTLVDDSWVEYTVELKRTAWDTLVGHYSAEIPFSESDQHEITLTRIVD